MRSSELIRVNNWEWKGVLFCSLGSQQDHICHPSLSLGQPVSGSHDDTVLNKIVAPKCCFLDLL